MGKKVRQAVFNKPIYETVILICKRRIKMKHKHIKKLILFPIILITFTAYSCAAKHTPVSTIKEGDSVKIITKTDEEIQFKVQEITSEAIMGEEEKVMLTDIYSIGKTTTSSEFKNGFTQTAAVVLAIPILLLMGGCC